MKHKSLFKFILVCIFLTFKPVLTKAQFWQWAKGIKGTNHVELIDFVLDDLGNIYCTGSFSGTVDFDPDGGVFNLAASSNRYGFYAKYSPSGALLWVNQLECTNTLALNIKLDNTGNIYVCGIFKDSLLVQNNYLIGSDFPGFIIKSTNTGILLWAKTFVPTIPNWMNNIMPVGISIDDNLNVYITGDFTCNTDFDPDTSTYILQVDTVGHHKTFYLKLDSSGTLIWAKEFSGDYSAPNSMNKDKDGNLLIYGRVMGSVDFDNDSSTVSIGDTGNFLCKVDTSGQLLFVKILRTKSIVSTVFGNEVRLDNQNNIYITGGIMMSCDFDPGPSDYYLTSVGDFDAFICVLDASGNFIWAKAIGSAGDERGRAIAIDIEKNIYITGNFEGNVDFDPGLDTFNLTSNGYGDVFLCILDSNGNFINAIGFGGPFEDIGFMIQLNKRNDIILSGYYQQTADFDPGPATFNLTSNLGLGGYFSKFLNEANVITGTIFTDYNGNGIMDLGDSPMRAILSEVNPGPFYVNSDTTGIYKAYTDTGNYTLTIPSPPLYRTVNPASQTASFSTFNNIDSLNDFGLYPIPNINDLRVTLTGFATSSFGNDHLIQITYSNIGTTVLSGNILLVTDSGLTYKNSVPPQNTINYDSVFWSFTNLQPLETRNILVTDSITAFAVDDTVISTAYIFPIIGDTVAGDNVSSITEIVNDPFPYDPNFKEVSPPDVITPLEVSNGSYLTYTIHFQNTGTDTATTVFIHDTLSHNLWMASFEIVSSSHSLTWNIAPSGMIEFMFDKIMLPDSNVNELLSHGFVKYRIKPKPTLTTGDVISNTAYIYFDFNLPVQTNEVVNMVGYTSVESVDASEKQDVLLFPNPANTSISVLVKSSNTQNTEFTIIDVYGRELYHATEKNTEKSFTRKIDLQKLNNGIYFLRINSGSHSICKKFVVDH